MKTFPFWRASALAAALACVLPAYADAAAPAVKEGRSSTAAERRLEQVADDYYMVFARNEPLLATGAGDNRFDDQLGMSIGPAQRAAHFSAIRKLRARQKAINPARLDSKARINYDILEHRLASTLASEQFPTHLLPVGVSGGFPSTVANFASGDGSQPIATPAQYRAYLSRVRQLTGWIDQAIINMRTGIKAGIVQPKALILAAIPKYDKLIAATPESSLFYSPITRLPASFSDTEKASLTQGYRDEIGERLNPALVRMAQFLKTEYLPAGRDSAGFSALPNGRAWYAERVAFHTSTSMTPAEIHALGLKEVARIQQQFAVLGPKMGYTGPAAGLPKWVGEQPKFYPFAKDEEIIEYFRKLDRLIEPRLAAMFTLQPKAPLEQRLEPELTKATASNHYSPPAGDGSRPGIFWSVVNDATKYNSTGMNTLYVHEGRPGHHFQLALQLEVPLPDFRKFSWSTAFGEGWALYAESLGGELGVFDAPDQYFGHLNDELLRAVRLVVDTGLHDKGWTREQAIGYMRETLGHSEAKARIAAERYMGSPGQAVAYKIGQLKISELRQKASAALGPKFVLSGFHRIVLEDGGMPLAVLENKVNRWIAASR